MSSPTGLAPAERTRALALLSDLRGGEVSDLRRGEARNLARIDAADLQKLVEAMPDFAGSEIEQVVISALYEAFDQDPHARELSTAQLLHAAKEIVPLAVTMQEKIADMREWAKTRARTASLVQTPAARRTRDRFTVPQGGDGGRLDL